MKIAPAKATTMIAKLPNSIKIILVYGEDYGLQNSYIEKIATTFLGTNYDTTQLRNISKSSLANTKDTIYEIAQTPSLFGSNKQLIVLQEYGEEILDTLEDILNGTYTDILWVVKSSTLPLRSKLRNFCEKHESCWAIPCYKDQNITLKSLILQELKEQNFVIDNNTLEYLMAKLGNDRYITLNELNKLKLYKNKEKKISFADIQNIISDNSNMVYDKFTAALFSLDTNKSYQYLTILLEEHPSASIMRSIINHLKRITHGKHMLSNNINFSQACKLVSPPVFFMYAESFKHHLALWNNNQLNKLLEICLMKELEIKSIGEASDTLLKDFVCKISLINQNKQKP